MSNLEQRARMHAALGEPVRLAIVDHLALGDTSPGELGTEFELATNLLAHHLKVLQEAGLIRRVRSEGDRRRSYVQLVLDDPLATALASPVGTDVRRSTERVVFVCTRNPAARVHPRAVRVGRRHGLNLDAGATANIVDVAQPEDLLVAVCDNAHEELRQTGLHWAVPDPVRVDTDQAFETAYEQITLRVERLAQAFHRA
jgi:DNA-binding transcriptional ArsR family regulator